MHGRRWRARSDALATFFAVWATLAFATSGQALSAPAIATGTGVQLAGPEAQLAPVEASPATSENQVISFAETAFVIADPAFEAYFTANGGLRTFGYPISNEFRLLGLKTQIFQRRVMQLGPDGPRLMNLLDDDFFPYTHVNGSVFPGNDPRLVAAAPSIDQANYAAARLDFVRAEVPDSFNGLAVNFFTLFNTTVPCPDEATCDSGIQAQMNLDMWGTPVSEPQTDPSSALVVYQRFQRGIMQYDGACGCTQAVLVGQYFRDILSGANLPSDLDAEAASSLWYGAAGRALADADFSNSGIPAFTASSPLTPEFAGLPIDSPPQPAIVAQPQPIADGRPAVAPGGGGGVVSIVTGGNGSPSGGGGGGSSGGGGGASSGAGGGGAPPSTPTFTVVPNWTPTATPTWTLSSTPTATPVLATATPSPSTTPTPTSTPNSQPQPVAGQPCPQWVHDQYATSGPDGRLYMTWHPPVDPTYRCVFGHEHGSDPRLAHANTSMPPFGYVGGLIGDNEPHEGFKVFYSNAGEVSEGQTVNADTRVVFHMGTGGVRRYTSQFHSMLYDYIARDGTGREAHIQGMADTGDTSTNGSGCDIRGHKSFSTVGCDNDYEVWAASKFQVIHPADPLTDILSTRVTMTFSPAVFDPITTRDPRDDRVLIYTQRYRSDPNVDPLSTAARYRGCSRESYFGPNFWHNAGQTTVYFTDVYGHVNPAGADAAHPLRQMVTGINSQAGDQFKIPRNYCDDTVHAPN